MTRLSPTEDLILEVLAPRHRLGEPWWEFDRANRPALERLRMRGLVEVVNDTRASLTKEGRRDRLDPDWKPAHVHAREDLAENLTDSAGMSWWIGQAHAHGLPVSAMLAVATAAEASIREWGRLLDEETAALYRPQLAALETVEKPLTRPHSEKPHDHSSTDPWTHGPNGDTAYIDGCPIEQTDPGE